MGCPRCNAELALFSGEIFARIGERDKARRALADWDARGLVADEMDRLVRLHAGALAEPDPAARATALESALTSRVPGLRVVRYRKPTFAKVAPVDLRHEISTKCDLVIEALAD